MKRFLYATAIAASMGTAAGAAPISVQFFSGSDLQDANSSFYTQFGSLTSGYTIENFEDRGGFGGSLENGALISLGGEGEVSNTVNPDGSVTLGSIETNTVGTFTGLGVGNSNPSGTTCGSLDLNVDGCRNIAIQDPGTINGQGNIVPFDGSSSININDSLGLRWTVSTGNLFDSVVFALRDVTDQGATVTIRQGDDQEEITRQVVRNALGQNNINDNLTLVSVSFGSLQSSAFITVTNSRLDDSFNFDGAAVNIVPLPAGMWMLLAGIGGFAALKRRRAA